jgi:hypothetical protein
MQLESALAPDEVRALGRLVSTPDAKRAIEAKFQVVSLSKVLEAGGFHKMAGDLPVEISYREMFESEWPIGRRRKQQVTAVPKLAITPSKAHEVQYRGAGKNMVFATGNWEKVVPSRWEMGVNGPRFTAQAPIVPAEARAVAEQYKFCLVLWEADWQPVPVPLGDPAILIPLIGDLYAVGAVWDLTELEKEVLRKAFV